MSSLNSVYIKKETLQTILSALEAKGETGVELTININDEGNQFDQNVSAYVSQTKEERDAEKKRFYVGNGRTFWTDGVIKVVKKAPAAENASPGNGDDLPF